jgi:hypothetical protein
MGSAIFACSSDLKKEFARMPRRAPQGSKWTRVQKAFRTDKDTNEARIGVKVGGVSGDTWFDDIAIIERE